MFNLFKRPLLPFAAAAALAASCLIASGAQAESVQSNAARNIGSQGSQYAEWPDLEPVLQAMRGRTEGRRRRTGGNDRAAAGKKPAAAPQKTAAPAAAPQPAGPVVFPNAVSPKYATNRPARRT